jgi:hypothetical protein
MTKQGFLNKFYGPFFRYSEDDKWHWKQECSSFPATDHPQTKITNKFPDDTELCDECMRLDKHINLVYNKKL